jgi:peptidoglycan/xylan/chitin deacetylase (PgdA/CDA1 family)
MAEKTIPILMYHSITSGSSAKFRPFTVPPGLFDRHLSYLVRNKYTSITLDQYCACLRSNPIDLPEKPVILTFDDGFADFYGEALSILLHHRYTATLYITTGFIGDTSRWLRHEREADRPMLSWEQIMEIDAYGIECGAHTHSHPELDMLPPARARDEITRSKHALEDRLGHAVSSFAYPFGYYTSWVRRWVQQAGFSSACAVKYALSSTMDDRFALPRLMVTADMQEDDVGRLLANPLLSPAVWGRGLRSRIWRAFRQPVALTKYFMSGGEVYD